MSAAFDRSRRRYPDDWRQISARVIFRAGNRCQWCGVFNRGWGWRDEDGNFHQVSKRALREASYDRPPFDLYLSPRVVRRIIEIVLTVAHLDQAPENCADENLRALCQRCHLNLDRSHRARVARGPAFPGLAARIAEGQCACAECRSLA